MSRPSNRIVPPSGVKLAVDGVEAGRFAGAVGADQRQKLAAADGKAHVIDRANGAEALAQATTASSVMPHASARQARTNAPTSPEGNASTRTRMMPPSSACQYSVCCMTKSCSMAKTDGADDRTGQRLDAAEQHHDQAVDGAADADGFRRDRALGKGENAAGNAANRSGDGEGEPMHALDVDADRLRAQRRVAAGAHRITERREQDAPQQQNADDDERQREQKERGKPIERRARPDAEHAVRAAGEILPLENDRPDDLREGERQHREIDPGQPHGEPAEQQRAQRGRDRRQWPAPCPSAPPAISPPARRHRRRGRNRRRGRTNACRPDP